MLPPLPVAIIKRKRLLPGTSSSTVVLSALLQAVSSHYKQAASRFTKHKLCPSSLYPDSALYWSIQVIRSAPLFAIHSPPVHHCSLFTTTTGPCRRVPSCNGINVFFIPVLYTVVRDRISQVPQLSLFSSLPPQDCYTSPCQTWSTTAPPKTMLCASTYSTLLSRFLKHRQIPRALSICDGTIQLYPAKYVLQIIYLLSSLAIPANFATCASGRSNRRSKRVATLKTTLQRSSTLAALKNILVWWSLVITNICR